MDLKIKVSRNDLSVQLPAYAKEGDAGADLTCSADITIHPGERVLAPTGLFLAIPMGYVGLIHPRSGLALKHGLTVLNAPGTIDAGYRGEIKVILLNTDTYHKIDIKKGDRIAQLVVQKVEKVKFIEVNELNSSNRGVNGFGSTGQ
jgi:dUTP pyrophosphatase